MLGFCTSARFVDHLTGPNHPERPDRIRAIASAVRAAGLIDSPNPFPEFDLDFGLNPVGGEQLFEIEPKPVELNVIEYVHSKKYIETIRDICQGGGGVLDSGDTPVCPASFDVALLSCGALIS